VERWKASQLAVFLRLIDHISPALLDGLEGLRTMLGGVPTRDIELHVLDSEDSALRMD
jgi:hypothetical protein